MTTIFVLYTFFLLYLSMNQGVSSISYFILPKMHMNAFSFHKIHAAFGESILMLIVWQIYVSDCPTIGYCKNRTVRYAALRPSVMMWANKEFTSLVDPFTRVISSLTSALLSNRNSRWTINCSPISVFYLDFTCDLCVRTCGNPPQLLVYIFVGYCHSLWSYRGAGVRRKHFFRTKISSGSYTVFYRYILHLSIS